MKDRFRNAMQMKALIKKQAALKAIDPRLLLEEYILDDLLERISLSPYRDNLVLKGGFLIASLIGIDSRSTKDMDATLVGLPLTEHRIMQVFEEICAIKPADDPIELSPTTIKPIRDEDQYGGYRIGFKGKIYDSIKPEIRIDISTGDVITPRAVKYWHHLLTEDRTIMVMAYNLETILAEKLEACLSNGAASTRPKDYYDVYILTQLEWQNIDFQKLRQALENTAIHRGSQELLTHYAEVLEKVFQGQRIRQAWAKYQRDMTYARDIPIEAVFAAIQKVLTTSQG